MCAHFHHVYRMCDNTEYLNDKYPELNFDNTYKSHAGSDEIPPTGVQ